MSAAEYKSPLAGWQTQPHDSRAEIVLADLSSLGRVGISGAGSCAWYASQGIAVPPSPNSLQLLDSGTLLVRLSAQEFLELCIDSNTNLKADSGVAMPPLADRTFSIARQHSHACLGLRGEAAASALSTVCALDLRDAQFSNFSVAQTQLAGAAAIVLRYDVGDQPGYLLLVPAGLAAYAGECLLESVQDIRCISRRDYFRKSEQNGECE